MAHTKVDDYSHLGGWPCFKVVHNAGRRPVLTAEAPGDAESFQKGFACGDYWE